jgi:hypothetical protein
MSHGAIETLPAPEREVLSAPSRLKTAPTSVIPSRPIFTEFLERPSPF